MHNTAGPLPQNNNSCTTRERQCMSAPVRWPLKRRCSSHAARPARCASAPTAALQQQYPLVPHISHAPKVLCWHGARAPPRSRKATHALHGAAHGAAQRRVWHPRTLRRVARCLQHTCFTILKLPLSQLDMPGHAGHAAARSGRAGVPTTGSASWPQAALAPCLLCAARRQARPSRNRSRPPSAITQLAAQEARAAAGRATTHNAHIRRRRMPASRHGAQSSHRRRVAMT